MSYPLRRGVVQVRRSWDGSFLLAIRHSERVKKASIIIADVPSALRQIQTHFGIHSVSRKLCVFMISFGSGSKMVFEY
jgi:hypothetical protein